MRQGRGPAAQASKLVGEALRVPGLRLAVFGTPVLVVALALGLDLWATSRHISENQWLVGFLVGFIIAAFLAIALFLLFMGTGSFSYLVGALGEKWTSEELADLGGEWHVYRNVPFVEGWSPRDYVVDVDVIAVGPYGVVLFETKYSSQETDLSAPSVARHVGDAVRQVEDNTGRVCALLDPVVPRVPVEAAVVFWGTKVVPASGTSRELRGVHVLAGSEMASWLAPRKGERNLSDVEVETIARRLDWYLESRYSRLTPLA